MRSRLLLLGHMFADTWAVLAIVSAIAGSESLTLDTAAEAPKGWHCHYWRGILLYRGGNGRPLPLLRRSEFLKANSERAACVMPAYRVRVNAEALKPENQHIEHGLSVLLPT